MSRSALVPDRLAERIPRCLAGLVCCGFGISMIVAAHLGLSAWDVFHQGAGQQLGLGIGWLIEITSFVVLLLWIPLRQRPGIGTILNAIVIGLVVNATADLIPSTGLLVARAGLLVGGTAAVAVGTGLYIGAGLGPGPRDGLMVGLAARGVSVRLARTVVEASALAVGLLLGGSAGVGTVFFTLAIGPMCQVALPRLAVRAHPAATPDLALTAGAAPTAP